MAYRRRRSFKKRKFRKLMSRFKPSRQRLGFRR